MADKEHEQITRIEPNEFYAPYAQRSLSRAENYYKSYRDVPYFPGQTYAGFDPATQAAHAGILGTAETSQIPGMASAELGRTLSGAYLDPNTDPRFARGLDTIENRIGSRFAASNRLGSGAFYNALADAEGAAAAQLYGQERQRMLGGLALAPGVEASRYAPYLASRGVGAEREAQAQRGINEQMARYEWGPGGGSERAALGLYGNSVNSSPYANYTQQVTPYYTNDTGKYLGYGLMGASVLAAPFTGGASLMALPSGMSMAAGGGGGGANMSGFGGLFGGGGGGQPGLGNPAYMPQLDPSTMAFLGG